MNCSYKARHKKQQHFLNWNKGHLLASWDTFFQILGVLNENALYTKEFVGLDVFKEI